MLQSLKCVKPELSSFIFKNQVLCHQLMGNSLLVMRVVFPKRMRCQMRRGFPIVETN